MARRARSADRVEEGVFYRLEEVLGRALQQPPAEVRDRFRAPSFDGTGNVDLFINQFEDVAQANRWDGVSARIHLRAALTDAAVACGQAEDVEHIFTALRARFGMTGREAKAKLAVLRKGQQTSLQEHAAQVDRLVDTAYAELPRQHQREMKLDIFQTSLGNAYLQRHSLAVQPRTLEDAVRAGNEFLQIQPFQNKSSILQIEEDIGDYTRKIEDPMQALLKAVARLTEEIHTLKTAPHPELRQSTQAPSTRLRCFGCNQGGHLRRDCTANPWPARQAGNEAGPQ